jgi:hypothetical protein
VVVEYVVDSASLNILAVVSSVNARDLCPVVAAAAVVVVNSSAVSIVMVSVDISTSLSVIAVITSFEYCVDGSVVADRKSACRNVSVSVVILVVLTVVAILSSVVVFDLGVVVAVVVVDAPFAADSAVGFERTSFKVAVKAVVNPV